MFIVCTAPGKRPFFGLRILIPQRTASKKKKKSQGSTCGEKQSLGACKEWTGTRCVSVSWCACRGVVYWVVGGAASECRRRELEGTLGGAAHAVIFFEVLDLTFSAAYVHWSNPLCVCGCRHIDFHLHVTSKNWCSGRDSPLRSPSVPSPRTEHFLGRGNYETAWP